MIGHSSAHINQPNINLDSQYWWRRKDLDYSEMTQIGGSFPLAYNAIVTGKLAATDTYVYFGFFMDDDWDAISDLIIEVWVALSAAETANDIIHSELRLDYFGDHELINAPAETQTINHDHNIGADNAQWTCHRLIFVIPYDTAGNLFENTDEVKCRFRLRNVTTETPVAEVFMLGAKMYYRSRYPHARLYNTHPAANG